MTVIRQLIWDDWNIAHIARHDVIPSQVEEVCAGPHISRASYSGRILLIGPAADGNLLADVLAPEYETDGSYYPVTARPAGRKERRLYRSEMAQERA